jgi:hypothetical protein
LGHQVTPSAAEEKPEYVEASHAFTVYRYSKQQTLIHQSLHRLRLERYFGSEAKGWLNLQAAYELRIAEIENGKAIAKEIQPFALAA